MSWSSVFEKLIAAAPNTTTVTVTSAGRSRRARRAQKSRSDTVADCSISRVTSRAIRKPETTKNTSTPRKPAGRTDGAKWKTTTAATAIARSPSSPPT